MTDPVFQATKEWLENCDADQRDKYIEGMWYFCDETWSDTLGPYDSEFIAREWLNRYVKEL